MIVRRMLGLLASEWTMLGLGVVFGAIAIGANVALMGLSAFLISKAAVATNVADLALAITSVRVLAIARAAFRYLERYTSHAATLRLVADLRVWAYAALEPLAPAGLVDRRGGDLLTRIVTDVDALEDLSIRVVAPPLIAALVTAGTCLALGVLDPALGVVVLAFLVLTGVALPLLNRRLSRAAASDVVRRRGELRATVVDTLSGIAELAALDQADRQRTRLLALGDAADLAAERLAFARAATVGLGTLLAGLCGVAVLGIAIGLVDAGRLDPLLLAAVPLAAVAAFEAVQPLGLSVQLLDTSRASAARLFELTDAAPAVVDPPEPISLPVAGDLAVHDLRFGYDAARKPIVDGLDLAIPEGGSLAVVGPSGAGKTTLVNLILRFWEPDAGTIRIGGGDVRTSRAADVRARIALVSQRVDLFDATIRDNCSLADPEATDPAILAACRVAQLDDLLERCPAGLDTRIGEDGVRLSGGERRRLAIARALLRDAPILILDEPTADLDPATEGRLIEALRPVVATRTTLLITHSPRLAAMADRTIVLDGGRIVG